MNKTDLIRAVSKETGIQQTDVAAVLTSVAQQTRGRLYHGEEVMLPDLGKLATKLRPARSGKNPQTGEAIDIPAKTLVVFKPEKTLRDVIAGSHLHAGVSE